VSALALALALASQQPLGGWAPQAGAANLPWGLVGRVYTSSGLHVGVRGAAYIDNEGAGGSIERAVGVTVQITWAGPF